MGFDIVHFNLHKTFTQPHGGGGPGAGPIAVSDRIEPYLPRPQVVRREAQRRRPRFDLDYDRPKSIGRLRGFQGNYGVFVRSYAYILLARRRRPAGGVGDRGAERQLPAGAAARRTASAEHLPAGLRPHLHARVRALRRADEEASSGSRTLDLAKRLLDHGFHPPTVYFPLLVDEALLIEPTETETQGDARRVRRRDRRRSCARAPRIRRSRATRRTRRRSAGSTRPAPPSARSSASRSTDGVTPRRRPRPCRGRDRPVPVGTGLQERRSAAPRRSRSPAEILPDRRGPRRPCFGVHGAGKPVSRTSTDPAQREVPMIRIRMAALAAMIVVRPDALGAAGIATRPGRRPDAAHARRSPLTGTPRASSSRARTRSTASSPRAASSTPSARSRASSAAKKVTKTNVRLPAAVANASAPAKAAPGPAAAAAAAAAGNACSILSLDLGPINLNLLGLVVRTNQIQLRIDAVQGPGNLLGNLLCAITGLLNPRARSPTTPLGQLAADPERAARARRRRAPRPPPPPRGR